VEEGIGGGETLARVTVKEGLEEVA